MKKIAIIISIGTMALFFASCNSMENDARKLAKMHYELQQVGDNIGSYTSKAKEVFEFEVKTWEKYSKNPDTKKQFQKTVDIELKKLKGK